MWIRHECGDRFVADPTVVTFHNRGRVYRRWRIAEEADRCDWIAYADDIVAEAAGERPRMRDRRPDWFPSDFAFAASDVYVRQRRLFERLTAGEADAVEVEEQSALLLDRALGAAPHAAIPRRRELEAIHHARATIAADPASVVSLRALSRRADMTPFQFCRVFSRISGETMTSYRLRLRLLSSLESLRAGSGITDVALTHGFSSHSHFTSAFRRAFGITPGLWRSVESRRRTPCATAI